MDRILKTGLVTLLFLLISSVTGYFAKYIPIDEFWPMFAVGSGVLVLGILILILFHKHQKIKPFVLGINAISMGFYLRSWYILRGFENELWIMLLVSLLATLYFLVYALFLIFPVINKYYGWYLLAFILLSIGGYVCLLVLTKTTWVSTLGYYGIIVLSFILCLSMEDKTTNEKYNRLLIGSYSIAICALIILIIALGGDGLDGFDIDIGDFSSPTSRKNKKKVMPVDDIKNISK